LTEYQIDGGIICNNPAMYAYEMAVYLYNQNKNDITVISLGTGEKLYN
jgi:patatin-like phospholipase/acyl hydrolase